jgi:23S rRNA pseudouridine1911/1915/1917 synthase
MSGNSIRKPRVIFEDSDLLVIIKPAGLVVNRADTVAEDTLQDWAENRLEIVDDEVFRQRSGIAHRLDKETSGVMVIGKNPTTLRHLMDQFKNRETSKEYLALVHGLVEPNEGIINLPLARSVYNRHRFKVDVFGKSAVTEYRVEKNMEGYALVRLLPKTGRTHQIRVHMAHIGHPLVGDEVYGGRKRSVRDRQWCPRHFLHATVLELTHPVTGKRVRFEADLADDLKEALNAVDKV